MVMGGRLVTNVEVASILEAGHRYDGIGVEKDLSLLIEPADWPGIRGNHSCDPSCWLTGPFMVAARREIRPDDEVTTDYATYTAAIDWRLDCCCGSALCRGIVTGRDWQLADVQERYTGHFAPFIAELIANGRA
jgi:hypothetical protein